MDTRNSPNTASIDAQNTNAAASATRPASNRGNGRKRRTTGHDPSKRSSKNMHSFEQLRRSQERLILSIGTGLVIGAAVGYNLGGYYPLTVGTGLSIGLAVGILRAS